MEGVEDSDTAEFVAECRALPRCGCGRVVSIYDEGTCGWCRGEGEYRPHDFRGQVAVVDARGETLEREPCDCGCGMTWDEVQQPLRPSIFPEHQKMREVAQDGLTVVVDKNGHPVLRQGRTRLEQPYRADLWPVHALREARDLEEALDVAIATASKGRLSPAEKLAKGPPEGHGKKENPIRGKRGKPPAADHPWKSKPLEARR